MHPLFKNLLEEEHLQDLTVIAAAVELGYDVVATRSVSLPKNYTSDQENHFCELCLDENVSVCAGILWLSDGGYLDYWACDNRWQYCAPVPAIPDFPNDETIDCMTNSTVHQFLNGTDVPVVEVESEDNGDGTSNVVITVTGDDPEKVNTVIRGLKQKALELGITGAIVTEAKEGK